MQNLYHAQQTAVEGATTTRALGEKIRRLEQALDEAQASRVTKEARSYEDSLIAGLRADAAQLAQEKCQLAEEKHKMRHCNNCNQNYCNELMDHKTARKCKARDRSDWGLFDTTPSPSAKVVARNCTNCDMKYCTSLSPGDTTECFPSEYSHWSLQDG